MMTFGDSYSQQMLAAKCDFFVESQLWPTDRDLNPDGWLSNFLPTEREYAECMLNAFLFFSRPLTEALFTTAFRRIARHVIDLAAPHLDAATEWTRFTESILVTHVTGESPSTTDSGYVFSRMARQILQLPPLNIVSPEVALQRLFDNGPAPVVFVDDFVGSGNQFNDTWTREYELRDGPHSFRSLRTVVPFRAFYSPVLCTSMGKESIAIEAPEVILSPAHFIDNKYNIFSAESEVWPDRLKPTAENFVQSASQRAGIVTNWRGFCNHGLLIAFSHCVPDATVPLIYHEGHSWIPLVRRT